MVKPLFDNVVLKPVKEEEKTLGGLYIPTAEKVSFLAEVVAVGKETSEMKVGDKVIYDKLKANEYKIDGETLIVISKKDIFAIVD